MSYTQPRLPAGLRAGTIQSRIWTAIRTELPAGEAFHYRDVQRVLPELNRRQIIAALNHLAKHKGLPGSLEHTADGMRGFYRYHPRTGNGSAAPVEAPALPMPATEPAEVSAQHLSGSILVILPDGSRIPPTDGPSLLIQTDDGRIFVTRQLAGRKPRA